ncbi:MAG: S8 family serine peptidase [Fimbriimonadales bacterium]|nr:S8 family serine peptidase [Fimbriimonadales bacterium]MDW8051115.1 S8 family serine peptidase [Armatimonadota bacterium]
MQRWKALMVVAFCGLVLVANAQELHFAPTVPAEPLIVQDAPYMPDELVIGLEQGEFPFTLLMIDWLGVIRASNPAINSLVLKLPPKVGMAEVAEIVRALPGVRYVEPNYIAYALATPNDPLFGQQYALARIQAPQAWDVWQPQRTVYIAIIDTGVDVNHPDLVNKLRRHSNGAVYGYNTLNNSTNVQDDNGHGTHCAGIAAAEIHNGTGIAGVAAWNPAVSNAHAFVQIMPVKVLNANGSGTLDAIARGITWAADNGAHILSLSLGAGSGAQQLQDAVNYAWNRGCLIVAAAGNSGSSAPMYPAYYTNCIAVAATDSTDTLASFSQYGSWVDIAAPGVDILSTYPSNRYVRLSGTSMACPHVAGAAAVLWSHNPSLSNSQLRAALETNVDPYYSSGGRTLAPNAGRLNVWRALQAVSSPSQPSLIGLRLSSSSVVGGNSVTGTVTLSAPAPAGGFVVSLSSSNPNVATVPSTVTVPAGATSANFTVSTRSVSSPTTVTITASANGVSRQATLTVNPATVTLQSLTISPSAVWGGQSATGTVTLTGPAPAGDIVVQLHSSSNRATVPSSVTVPAGATSASFVIRTRSAFSVETVTITATYGGVSRSAQLTVWF